MTYSQKLKRQKIKRDNPAQSRAFIKKARELEADEESSRSDELVERLARKPPDPRKKKDSP